MINRHFCCKHCQSDVAIEHEPGGDRSYICQNPHCQWACSVHCPEALAIKPHTPAPITWDGAALLELDTPQARKAAYHLAQGVRVVPFRNGWLVPSSTRSSVIHQVSAERHCSCEAGQNGRACWHVAAITLIAAQHVAA